MEGMVKQILEIILVPLIAFIVGLFLLGLARKVIARIHWRYGPPITQPVIDIIRFFSQRSVSHGGMFNMGIILSLAASFAVVLFLPFGVFTPLAGSGGLLVILYIMIIAPIGIAFSSGEGANPNISIGISRKLILSFGYEVPLLLILLSVMTHYGTISIVDIVKAQEAGNWALFSWPLVLPGIAYFLILPAMLGLRPFDVASALQEISSGPQVEYGGRFLALVTIEHGLAIFITIGLFVDLFLGGGGLWHGAGSFLYSGPGAILTPVVFLIKMLVVFLLGLFVHSVFPRFRVEQALRYLWRWPTAFALVGLVIVMIAK
ncbi:MAG: hypothetical protein B6D63_05790 [Candidatus Latescibacteria bacterium 4484_7]|nr:MAG: hypothetical protein B6D63_05790 [Candidatus Latescibacteria bacterium 4484_7]